MSLAPTVNSEATSDLPGTDSGKGGGKKGGKLANLSPRRKIGYSILAVYIVGLVVFALVFGVNAVRKPDAFATMVLKLSSYRKLDPGPLEEMIFYDHPSGRTRIAAMMRWKKEHVGDPDIRDSVSGNPR